MKGNLLKQLDKLEAAVKIREAAKAAHAPYIVFRPWDMLNDQYNVTYYPEGKYEKPVRYDRISYADARRVLGNYPDSLWCQISMGECLEWLFVFHFHFRDGDRNIYTQDQTDRLTEKYISQHPQLEQLMSTEWGKQMMETLSRLPQTAMIRLGDLIEAIE